MTMKYIIYQMEEGEVPLIFPNSISHQAMSKSIDGRKVVSAGFLKMTDEGFVECYGRSITLKIRSREKHDTILINHYMALNPV